MKERLYFMKKVIRNLFILALTFVLVFGTNTVASANTKDRNAELHTAYETVLSYAVDNNVPLDMTYDIFVAGYNEQVYSDVQAYINVYYSLLQPQSAAQNSLSNVQTNSLLSSDAQTNLINSSSGGDAWYYNIGTSLPQVPNYSKYKLLSSVQKGDVVYEANAGYGITGHIAIVEGIFNDPSKGSYIRVIEAIEDGVVRSCLDDTRVDDKDVTIYRVKNATTVNTTNAVNFCIGELGSSYNLDFAKDTSSAETDWYCSELVWAAYKNQGINIETSALINEPGVTPRDIARSSNVSSVTFK
jgi:hypothetical protein